MKRTAGLMCLGSFYAGALWIEYQTAVLLGAGCFLFAAGSALTFWLPHSIALRKDTSDVTVFTYTRGIAGRAWFVTADSRNPHVHDNEMRLAVPRQFH